MTAHAIAAHATPRETITAQQPAMRIGPVLLFATFATRPVVRSLVAGVAMHRRTRAHHARAARA